MGQAERGLFDAIYLVPLQRRDIRSADKEALCKAMGAAIGFEDASNEREIVFLLQVGTSQAQTRQAGRWRWLYLSLDCCCCCCHLTTLPLDVFHQDKHPSTRVILLLDGADRFLSRAASSSTVQVLSYLLSRLHGLHLLITAEVRHTPPPPHTAHLA